MTSIITVNGMKITVEGSGSIHVSNNNLIIDGKRIEIGNTQHDLIIEGNCGNINCDCSVTVNGNVNGDIDCGGSCKCGDVSGSVDAGGSVTANNISGDIDAGGSVHVSR